jgi:uncharacterized protein (DUF4415 family)
MAKKENIVRYSIKEIDDMIARGESLTDWAKVDAKTPEEIERLADEDDGPLPEGWEDTIIVGNPFKKDIHIRLDPDIINWFKAQGRGYQTRINAALRTYMIAHRRRPAKAKEKRSRK